MLTDPGSYAADLRRCMRALKPVVPRASQRPHHVPSALSDATHVFVRRGARSGLQCPYDGPFKVVSRDNKTVVVCRDGKQDRVSIDRAKPAFVDPEPASAPPTTRVSRPDNSAVPADGPLLPLPRPPPPMPPPPPRPCLVTTRSGRTVRPPVRFQHVTFASDVPRGEVV